MCDYSLMGVPNRLANAGEELVIYEFPTKTKGLALPVDVDSSKASLHSSGLREKLRCLLLGVHKANTVTAVCIPPGSRLMLCNIPAHLQLSLNVGLVEEGIFTQMTATPYVHRDAVRFHNGNEVLLQTLPEGQRVKVLSLDLDVATEPVHGDGMILRF